MSTVGKNSGTGCKLIFRPNAARFTVLMKTIDLWKIFQLEDDGVSSLGSRTKNFVMSVDHSSSSSSSCWHSEIQKRRMNGHVVRMTI